jgi:short subunit dehydrogenase-like uncharacterized protein
MSQRTKRSEQQLDITLFGATGFVGRLAAEYLAQHAPQDVRIGLAGRSESRLASVREALGSRAARWPLVRADAADQDSLSSLVASTRVVATTVGPYRAKGLGLVQACAVAGTDYADLTGEVLFIRETIDRCHDAAAASGARVVHACGFDAIPSDLGVLLLHEAAVADDAGDLESTTLVLKGVRGGVSGGTVATLKGVVDDARRSRTMRRTLADPYALSPERAEEPDLGDEGDLVWVTRDDELGTWLAPFVMSSFNTRIVRRSNALQGWAYGRGFRYRETVGVGDTLASPAIGAGVSAALAGLSAGLAFGPTRGLLDRVLPKPGAGPSERTRSHGFFKIEIHTLTSRGRRYVATVAAQGDPGYAASAVMFGESALCLALDGTRLPDRAGVLTPATAMGDALVDRLRRAGQTLEVKRGSG